MPKKSKGVQRKLTQLQPEELAKKDRKKQTVIAGIENHAGIDWTSRPYQAFPTPAQQQVSGTKGQVLIESHKGNGRDREVRDSKDRGTITKGQQDPGRVKGLEGCPENPTGEGQHVAITKLVDEKPMLRFMINERGTPMKKKDGGAASDHKVYDGMEQKMGISQQLKKKDWSKAPDKTPPITLLDNTGVEGKTMKLCYRITE
ncbi:hypothetical protein NHX12_025380 [Muraenolepis orangiensis]|uniref:Uncharacterized protein n=1 Tax=Muraenolepis orangiensis TaxID=630683 RepID=A0A9Q0EK20_9TELE|nr:hypothetical protein NHX12_025380 [Muraenolepis orangiensis]